MPTAWKHDDPRSLTIEKYLTAVIVMLFVHSLLEWRGFAGDAPAPRSLRMVYLTGAMLLQSLSVLVRARSRWLSWGLLAVSMTGLGLSVVSS